MEASEDHSMLYPPSRRNSAIAYLTGNTTYPRHGKVLWDKDSTLANSCGLFSSGWASECFGYKKTMLGGYIAIAGLVFMQIFATNVQVLLASEILIGFPLGIFLALTTVYASEVCPVVLRSYLTTYVNLCWNIGKFVSTGVLRSQVTNESEWAYRIPFAVQWG